jgi:hypothetical protein
MEDSMEVWVPLLSALVGGLIAVVPVLITLRYQAEERKWDRQEQKREAKTQLEIELVRNDIQVIEQMIDNDLKLIFFYGSNKLMELHGEISDDERRIRVASFRNGAADRLAENRPRAITLAMSLGQNFANQYKEFNACVSRLIDFLVFDEDDGKDIQEENEKMYTLAAELHKTLRDKLISIRDS